jgi:transcriptional regulator with XRE-family HTH domain
MARPDWTQIAPHIREARKALGLSIFEVSRRTGIREPSLYAYERGTTEPQATALIALCALYGIDPLSFAAA